MTNLNCKLRYSELPPNHQKDVNQIDRIETIDLAFPNVMPRYLPPPILPPLIWPSELLP